MARSKMDWKLTVCNASKQGEILATLRKLPQIFWVNIFVNNCSLESISMQCC